MPRFHCPVPLQPGCSVALPDAVARHAIGALRLRDGETVTLFNGDGHEYTGILRTHGPATAEILAQRTPERESPLRIVLAQGVSSGERMDMTIQKSVELGIAAIQPLTMRRSIVRLNAEKSLKRRSHWQGVAISACEQCGRNQVPEVADIAEFPLWCRTWKANGGIGLMLDPEARQTLAALSRPEGPITLLAGPEGGFDPAESQAAQAAGFIGVRLGPRILRTETAALAAIAALQMHWGDF